MKEGEVKGNGQRNSGWRDSGWRHQEADMAEVEERRKQGRAAGREGTGGWSKGVEGRVSINGGGHRRREGEGRWTAAASCLALPEAVEADLAACLGDDQSHHKVEAARCLTEAQAAPKGRQGQRPQKSTSNVRQQQSEQQ